MKKREIIFLGTGAAEAKKYSNSCFYIKDVSGGMLVDTGGGNQILTQLEKSGIRLEEINYIYITHKHIDHLLGIFWILRFLGSKINKGEVEKLTIYCSQDVAEIIKNISAQLLKKKVNDLFDDKIVFEIINDSKKISLHGWEITCFDMHSTKDEQYGFRLKFADGLVLTSFGDEPYNEKLLNYAKNSDYIIHDAFCLEKDMNLFKPHEINHATVKDAADNATALETKNLILFHSEESATFGKRKQLYTEEAKQYFSGNIFVPEDLEKILLEKVL